MNLRTTTSRVLRVWNSLCFIAVAVLMCVGLATSAAAVTLVEEGEARATIILPDDALPLTVAAAEKLARYVEQISGASLPIVTDPQAVQTPARIWVGYREELAERFPEQDFAMNMPEEILFRAFENDLILMGRDEAVENVQTQAGTKLAVLTFLQEYLDVRWFWPGPWGTDVPQRQTIDLAPFEYRYHPQLRYRQLRASQFSRAWRRVADPPELPGIANTSVWLQDKDREVRRWLNRHRIDHAPSGQRFSALRGSLTYSGGHAYQQWWSRFHEQHPEWFALQHDGTRSPYPNERDVKLCISNPEVAEQWLNDAEVFFRNNPDSTVYRASFNDRGWQGFCRCDNCLAWDNPDAPILERPISWADHQEEHYALTDRYVKFWNILARGLRERFPGRDVNVGVYAYHVTRPAPTMRQLEDNVVVGFVGIRRRDPVRNSLDHIAEQQQIWKAWANAAGQLVWRPNLIHRTLGLPYVFMHRHGENFNFLAEHNIVGIDVDSIGNHWATQGPQYYVTAQLTWNPRLNVEDILEDYYQRAFGPAAEHIASYFDVFEQLYYKFADNYTHWHRYADLPTLYREMEGLSRGARDIRHYLGHEGAEQYQRGIERQAAEHLAKAIEAVADGPEIYRQRVAFIATGFEFTQAQLDAVEAMNDLREGVGGRDEALARAYEAAERRERILHENLNNFALSYPQLLPLMQQRQRNFGPPTE